MPNFVDDDTDLDFPKVDRRPKPPSVPDNKWIPAGSWNDVCQAAYDLRDAVQALQGGGGASGTTYTVQTYSAPTGIQTVTLNASTTILRFTASAQIDLVGLTGGADGRLVVLENHGSANVILYIENNNATEANRLVMDGNSTGILVHDGGKALATYDGTLGRWSVCWLMTMNTPGSLTVNGTFTATGACGFQGASAIAKPTVTGSRGGNAALASVLTALAGYGLITDSTS